MIDKTALLTYLSDLQQKYLPSGVDITGRWVGGDEELYYFIKDLAQKIEGWSDAK